MSDMDYAEDDYVDEGAGLANGVVIVTGLVMIVAIYLMLKALAGMLSDWIPAALSLTTENDESS